MPNADAVRAEEMVNYFPLNARASSSETRSDHATPFTISYELSPAPRNEQHTLLVNDLREQDRIAIVTYSGSSEVLLASTSGADKKTILNALDSLDAGGSTNGGAGLKMAYQQAEKGLSKEALTVFY
ncbi:von Willebrand factor type A domain-containing protein [Buttiauxella sp. JUb87]|nr:von Willebrand factor type A domain-containing protein [Buttiauxella sp. JUb87]